MNSDPAPAATRDRQPQDPTCYGSIDLTWLLPLAHVTKRLLHNRPSLLAGWQSHSVFPSCNWTTNNTTSSRFCEAHWLMETLPFNVQTLLSSWGFCVAHVPHSQGSINTQVSFGVGERYTAGGSNVNAWSPLRGAPHSLTRSPLPCSVSFAASVSFWTRGVTLLLWYCLATLDVSWSLFVWGWCERVEKRYK